MTRHPPELILAGGQLWQDTAAMARLLAAGEPGRPRPSVVVWDEEDVDQLWEDRPDAFVVRSRPLPTWLGARGAGGLGARIGRLELRRHLRSHRSTDIALVGRVALAAAPWLRDHRGMRAWVPTGDDLPALGGGLVIPAARDGGPHVIFTTDEVVARDRALAADGRLRWDPGMHWTPPPITPIPEVLALGPPDRTHGYDLVARALAHHQHRLRAAGASVRWFAPLGAEVPDELAEDARQAGVLDLITVVRTVAPWDALRERCASAGAAALVLCGRPGALLPHEYTYAVAYDATMRIIAFHPAPPGLDVELRWSRLGFGDVAGIADAVLDAVERPIGLGAAFAKERSRG